MHGFVGGPLGLYSFEGVPLGLGYDFELMVGGYICGSAHNPGVQCALMGNAVFIALDTDGM